MLTFHRWLGVALAIGGICQSGVPLMSQDVPSEFTGGRVPPSPGRSFYQRPAGNDDEPIGRRYVPPPLPPAAPGGIEELMQQPKAAAAVPSLSLETLLSLACQNNPTLQQAQQQVNGTLGKALEAGLWPNPTLYYIGEQIFVQSDQRRNTPGEFQGGAVQQEFVTAGKRRLSREKYLHRAKSAEWLAVAQQWKVCNDVRIHFWKSLADREIVAIRRELLKAAEDSALTVRERYRLGQATHADVRMSNVSLQKARLSLLQGENRFRGQFRTLSSIVGVELQPQPLVGQLEEGTDNLISFDAALSRIYAESPEVLAAKAKWQADYVTVERERVQPIPNVFVKAGTGYNFESREPVASAQVFFDVPIFDRNQGTVQQAEADLARQSAEIRRVELRLRQHLSHVYQEYLTALQNVTEFEAVILPEARDAYNSQLDAYEEDRQNWGDVLYSQRDYFDLREQFVEHLMTWRTNAVLIEGFLLQGGLDAAPLPTPAGHIDSVAQPR